MSIKYFGQFLLEKRYLLPKQILEAVEHQRETHVKFGIIAIDQGFLTANQVNQILVIQKNINKRFGEIAIEKGFLTTNQVNQVLETQRSDRIMLGQALVAKNFLTLKLLESYLLEYHNEQEKAQTSITSTLESIEQKFKKIVKESCETATTMLGRLFEDQTKIFDCQIKERAQPKEGSYIVSQEISGDETVLIELWLDEQTILSLVSKMFGATFKSCDEFAVDGIKEILNIIVGHICSSLSTLKIAVTASNVPSFTPVKNLNILPFYNYSVVLPISLTNAKYSICIRFMT